MPTSPDHASSSSASKNGEAPTSSHMPVQTPLQAPPLSRRMACWMYEGILLFGVLFVAGYFFSIGTRMHGEPGLRFSMQLFIFIVLAAYFGLFWSHGRQTLAMKTWLIRVVDRHGQPLRWPRALWRYMLGWLWLLPPLAAVAPLHLPGAEVAVLVMGWIALWALLSRFMPGQQFVHDMLAGTRLVRAPRMPDKKRKDK